MRAQHEELTLETKGDGDVLDVTADAQKAIDNADASVNAGNDFIDSMKTALQLNPKAYSSVSTVAPVSSHGKRPRKL